MYNAAQIYRYIFPKIKIEDNFKKNEAKQIRNNCEIDLIKGHIMFIYKCFYYFYDSYLIIIISILVKKAIKS